MKIAIVGAGVLGTALAILLKRAGYTITAISSRNRRRAQDAVAAVGEGEPCADPGSAARGADLVLLAVPDRAIAAVSLELASSGSLRKGAVVAHLAGGLPAGVLAGVAAAGAARGSIHPLQSFADLQTAVRHLPEAFFFLEGDQEAVDVLRSVVVALDGRPVEIDGSVKALYHAGAAAASNFLVTVVDYAVTLLFRAGVPRDAALGALMPLIRGTVANLEAVGLPSALTGPIARGDTGTLRRHLRALEKQPGDLTRLYRSLARQTIEVALRKRSIGTEEASEMMQSLYEGRPHLGPEDLPPA